MKFQIVIERFTKRLSARLWAFRQLFRRIDPFAEQPRTLTIMPPSGYDAPNEFIHIMLAKRRD